MSAVTRTMRNGVDTEKLYATLDLLKEQPELGRFQFRATNRWIDGPHNRSTIKGFFGAGAEDATRTEAFEVDAGEPALLLGTDTGRQPGRVPAARPRRLPDHIDRLRRRRPQGRADLGRVDADRRHGCPRRARRGREAPQRLRAHPRVVPRHRPRSRGEAPRGRGAGPQPLGGLRHGHQRGPRRAGPVEHGLDEPCRSNSQAHTRSGARLVASAEQLAGELAARAAEHDRDGSYPYEAIEALRAVGYFAAPIRRGLRRPRGELRARPGRRLEPAGARRRLGGDRREHAPRGGAEHGAPPPGRGRGGRRAAGARVRLLAGADRRRRRRARCGDQRGRAGHHPAGHGGDPHRGGLADRRAQAVLHHVARRRPTCTSPSPTPTARTSSATRTRWCPPTPPAS